MAEEVEMRDVQISQLEDDAGIKFREKPSGIKYKGLAAVVALFLLVFAVIALATSTGKVMEDFEDQGFYDTGPSGEAPAGEPSADEPVAPKAVPTKRPPTKIPLDCIFVGLTGGCFAIVVLIGLTYFVLDSDVGDDSEAGRTMNRICRDIAEGARAFLHAEYKGLAVFVVVVAILLGCLTLPGLLLQGVNNGMWKAAICFIVGAFTSACCGYLGMMIATQANVRTCQAARGTLNDALRVAFNGGTVMGLSVVGFGLVVLSIMLLVFRDLSALAGFGFGASSIALFARVGGGIYTKAADVGADLVGKVRENLPEDDPRNPAVIADNVGDNVGDVAGMGADLFESYVGSIIAALTLSINMYDEEKDLTRECVAVPLYIAAAGIVCSVFGASMVRASEGGSTESLMNTLLWAIRRGILIASGLNIVVAFIIVSVMAHWVLSFAFIFGLVAGVLIGFATEYYTSFEYKPTRDISESGLTGPATVIIKGMATGMLSVIPPTLILVVCILASDAVGEFVIKNHGGEYALAIAAIGMLSTLGVTLATDAYGPIADNAGGIAEMAGLPEEVREKTDALDSLGNTTAATGKGFAIGSAVLTAVALLRAFKNSVQAGQANPEPVDVLNVFVLCGICLGCMLPYIFASLTMTAVGNSAQAVIVEVIRQFDETPGLLEGRPGVHADHTKCVAIATNDALKKMILPGVITIVVPPLVGFIFGHTMLLGVLAGAILSGFILAVTMANAGGAWDNAKKWVEAGRLTDPRSGEVQGKRTEAHKATVVGDTVGDPFKDTSGPALNILIKLMSVLSLVLAPAFKNVADGGGLLGYVM